MSLELYRSTGTGPGTQTRDGCSVELYKLTSYRNELEPLKSILNHSSSVLELGCGAGRLSSRMLEWGLSVTGVDNSVEMLAELPEGVRGVHSNIENLALGETFDTVLLASYIINTPDAALRESLLATAKRHLKRDGTFLVECHDADRLRSIQVGRESTLDDITSTIEAVEQIEHYLRILISYRNDALCWSHEFDVMPFEEHELEGMFAVNGFQLERWIKNGSRWAVVTHND